MPNTRNRQTALLRRSLLAGAALACLGLAAAPQSARAQVSGPVGAFQGDPTVTLGAGNVQIDRSANFDLITISNQETAIIDWSTYDSGTTGTVDFLPTGTTALFRTNTLPGFTVLNRIAPRDASGNAVARAISLNGTVNGQVGNNRGGNVWFYSPSGIIAGGTSVFNLGGLVLTTSAIDTINGLPDPAFSPLSFTGSGIDPASFVRIDPGASINLTPANSYLAIVAPRVSQGGNVRVNGSVAYVGAEAADITINGGLFDIAITTGTADPNGVVHEDTGSTGGPATQTISSGQNPVSDPQRIFAVAVPKSGALTMLMGGRLGYDAVLPGFEDSGAVVLSAGYGITGGQIDADLVGGSSAPPADITVGQGTGTVQFTSAVTGKASNIVRLTPARALIFDLAADFTARQQVDVLAGTAASIFANTSLSLTASDGAAGGAVSVLSTGTGTSGASAFLPGSISVREALTISVGGNNLPSSQRGGSPGGGSASGGTVSVIASQSGAISVGRLEIGASAVSGRGVLTGGSNNDLLFFGGPAIAGDIGIEARGNGTITSLVTVLDASADAALSGYSTPETGGNATGGTVAIVTQPSSALTGGSLDLGDVSIDITAVAGDGASGDGGSAFGGTVNIDLAHGANAMASLLVEAGTMSGGSLDQGNYGASTGSPDAIRLRVSEAGTSLDIADFAAFDVSSRSFLSGISGGELRAGNVTIEAVSGGNLTVGERLSASVSTTVEVDTFNGVTPTTSSDAISGMISLIADGGTINAGNLELRADSTSGFRRSIDIANPGAARAGTIEINALNDGFISISGGACGIQVRCDFNAISAVAQSSSGPLAGSAIGGTVTLNVEAGTFLDGAFLTIDTSGNAGVSTGGVPGIGGDGIGGTITVNALPSFSGSSSGGPGGSSNFDFYAVELISNGSALVESEGPDFNRAAGAGGRGGTIRLNLDSGNGSFSVATDLSITADGLGAPAAASSTGTAFNAGNGVGGNVSILIGDGTSVTVGQLFAGADGFGGDAEGGSSGLLSGISGDGTGGTVDLQMRAGSSLTAQFIGLSADGFGGDGIGSSNTPAPNGGSGTGGLASLNAGNLTADEVFVESYGEGGEGGNQRQDSGGSGSFRILAAPSAARVLSGQPIAGAGGSGTGGTARVLLNREIATIGLLTVDAGAEGGAGGTGSSPVSGGDGGAATGGSATIEFQSEGHLISDVSILSGAIGGSGGSVLATYDPETDTDTFGNTVGGTGGLATGGSALLQFTFDPTLDSVTIDTSATGGAGGNGALGGDGGIGQGGNANFDVLSSQVTVTGATEVISGGVGGIGGNGQSGQGGTGGTGIGGSATIFAEGNTLLTTSTVSVDTGGFGGRGGQSALSSGNGVTGGVGGIGQGGGASIIVTNGAQMDLGGAVLVSATAQGGDGERGRRGSAAGAAGGAGGAANGTGIALLEVTNGAALSYRSNASVALSATSQGGAGGEARGTLAGGTGGAASGGTARLRVNNAQATLNIATLDTLALGGAGGGNKAQGAGGGRGGRGGSATGGTADLSVEFGRLAFDGLLTIGANGSGGAGAGATSAGVVAAGRGGIGTGGNVTITSSGTDTELVLQGLTVTADGAGGESANSQGSATAAASGQRGEGGSITLTVEQISTTTLAGNANLSASGTGSAGAFNLDGADGGIGGAGIGGTITVNVDEGTLNANSGTTFTAAANGTGANGGFALLTFEGGEGGLAEGGSVTLDLSEAAVNLPKLVLQADAQAGNGASASGTGTGGVGGNGEAGTVSMTMSDSVLDATDGLTFTANGTGGFGGSGDIGGNGGSGSGGTIALAISDATSALNLGTLDLLASGTGSTGGTTSRDAVAAANGGGAQGGAVSFSMQNGSTTDILGVATLRADAIAANGEKGADGNIGGNGGNGGNAVAGAVTVDLRKATLQAVTGNAFTLTTRAQSGAGGDGGFGATVNFGGSGGSGGMATGGTIGFTAISANYDIAFMEMVSYVDASFGGIGGLGGFTIPAIPGNPNASPPVLPVPERPPTLGGFGSSFFGAGGTVTFTNTDDGTDLPAGVRTISNLNMRDVQFSGGNSILGGKVTLIDDTNIVPPTDGPTPRGGLNMSGGNLFLESSGFSFNPADPAGIFVQLSDRNLAPASATLIASDAVVISLDGTASLGGSDRLYIFGSSKVSVNHTGRAGSTANSLRSGTVEIYSFGQIATDVETLIDGADDVFIYGGDVALHNVTARRTIGLAAFNSITADSLIAPEDVTVEAGSNVVVGVADAGDDFEVDAGGDITVASGFARGTGQDGRKVLFSVGGTTLSALSSSGDSSDIDLDAGGSVSAGSLAAGDDLSINAGQAISVTGSLRTLGLGSGGDSDVDLNAGTDASIANVIAFTDLNLSAGSSATAGTLTAGDDLSIFAGGALTVTGSLLTQGVNAASDSDIDLRADGNASIASAFAVTDLVINTGGSITAGDLIAGDDIEAFADDSITVTGSLQTQGAVPGSDSDIDMGAATFVNIVGADAFSDFEVTAESFTATADIFAGEDIVLDIAGDITMERLFAGDDIVIDSSGVVDFVEATNDGTGPDDADEGDVGANITITAAASIVALTASARNDLTFSSPTVGVSSLDAGNNVVVNPGDSALSAGVSVGSIFAGNSVFAQAQQLDIVSVSAGSDAHLYGFASTVLGDVTAGDDIGIVVQGTSIIGSLTTTGAGDAADPVARGNDGFTLDSAGSTVHLVGRGFIAFESVDSAGNVVLAGLDNPLEPGITRADGDIVFLTDFALSAGLIDAGGIVAISGTALAADLTGLTGPDAAFGDYDFSGLGSAVLPATGGAATFTAPVTAGSLRANIGGALTGGSITVDDIADLTASGAIRIDRLAAGEPVRLQGASLDIGFTSLQVERASASGDGKFTGTGTLGFTASSNAANFDIQAGDIVIGAGGRLTATQKITLSNGNRSVGSTIGGNGSGGGFNLSADEIGRLAARQIDITLARIDGQTASSAPDVTIDAFTLNAGGSTGALPADGSFNVTGTGRIRVQGAVRFAGLSTGTVSIIAAETLEVIAGSGAGSGSITINDGNGALAGSLSLRGRTLIAATADAIAAVASAATIGARNDRLGLNDSVLSEDGMFSAGKLRLAGISGIYVQNTGGAAFADRRGFTTGELTISTGDPAAEIIVNGRLLDSATGSTGFITGVPVIGATIIVGPTSATSSFAAGSTINNCMIASPSSCSISSGDGEESPPGTRDIFKGPLGEDDDAEQLFEQPDPLFPTSLIEVKEFDSIGFPPLIDEPVTGAGNEDLWEAPCDPAGGTVCQ